VVEVVESFRPRRLPGEDAADEDVGGGVVGVCAKGVAENGEGGVGLAGFVEHLAEVAVLVGEGRVELDGAAEFEGGIRQHSYATSNTGLPCAYRASKASSAPSVGIRSIESNGRSTTTFCRTPGPSAIIHVVRDRSSPVRWG
jgi:hypothetical protein